MNVEDLISPHLREMQPYTPIVPFEVLSRRLGRAPEDIVKLDANENPYGPSPRALEAILRAGTLHIYPDPEQTLLREAIAGYIGLPMDHILCGAGGDEIIDLIGRAFIQPGDAIVDLPPTFGMYRWEADVVNATYVTIPRRSDFSIDVDRVVDAVTGRDGKLTAHRSRFKILFLTSPNNPDGSTVPDEQLRRLLKLPLVVVVDEAYIDFSAQPSRADWVPRHDNLIVLRTFSKLAGMAGLRVGYGVFPPNVIKHLWKIKQPYTPNVAGSVAAIAALNDSEYMRDSVRRIVAERARLGELLSELAWLRPLPSEANFVLCRVAEDAPWRTSTDVPAGKQLKLALEPHGVLVRWFDKDGLRDCIRVSVGRPDQTDRLMLALHAVGTGRGVSPHDGAFRHFTS
jgi:histidinol-phosphate aminotransferase